MKFQCPSIEICAADLSDWSQAKTAVESLGHFDLLVNSAGVSRIGPFVDVKEEDFDLYVIFKLKVNNYIHCMFQLIALYLFFMYVF